MYAVKILSSIALHHMSLIIIVPDQCQWLSHWVSCLIVCEPPRCVVRVPYQYARTRTNENNGWTECEYIVNDNNKDSQMRVHWYTHVPARATMAWRVVCAVDVCCMSLLLFCFHCSLNPHVSLACASIHHTRASYARHKSYNTVYTLAHVLVNVIHTYSVHA